MGSEGKEKRTEQEQEGKRDQGRAKLPLCREAGTPGVSR